MTFRFPAKLAFKSICLGIAAALVLGAVAFALAPVFDAVGIYIAPAALIVPLLGPVIPSRLMDWLVPDGGAPAGVLLILASAIVFWTILFGAVFFGWAVVSKQKRAIRNANS